MRKFLLVVVVLFAIAIAVGAGVGMGVHWSGLTRDMTVSVDGETLHGSLLSAVVGGTGAVVAIVVCLGLLLALASVAIIVPLALVVAAGAAGIAILVAIVAGLSPILVPVLLVVGAYALLSRRGRRTSDEAPAAPRDSLSA